MEQKIIDENVEERGEFTYITGVSKLDDGLFKVYASASKDGLTRRLFEKYGTENDALDFFDLINQVSPMCAVAILLSRNLHRGQVDRGGHPYMFHPLRVGSRFPEEVCACVGFLHDVVEDTTMSLVGLNDYFPEVVVEAVDCISRRKGKDFKETDEDYFKRIKANEISVFVKIADLSDNMNAFRLATPFPTVEDAKRIRKYADQLLDLTIFCNENNI